jgi:hypothetical protein
LSKITSKQTEVRTCFDFETENGNVTELEKGENCEKTEFTSCNWQTPFPIHVG